MSLSIYVYKTKSVKSPREAYGEELKASEKSFLNAKKRALAKINKSFGTDEDEYYNGICQLEKAIAKYCRRYITISNKLNPKELEKIANEQSYGYSVTEKIYFRRNYFIYDFFAHASDSEFDSVFCKASEQAIRSFLLSCYATLGNYEKAQKYYNGVLLRSDLRNLSFYTAEDYIEVKWAAKKFESLLRNKKDNEQVIMLFA